MLGKIFVCGLGDDSRTPLESKTARIELDMTDRKARIQAGKNTGGKTKKAKITFQRAFINDVRTRVESHDPSLLVLLDDIRTIIAMVEEEDQMVVHPLSESYARESKKDAAVADTVVLHQ